MGSRGLALLGVWTLASSGCSGSCGLDINQPACANRFLASRAVVHRFASGLRDQDAVTDEHVGLRGDVDLGPSWAVDVLQDNLYLGFPETGAATAAPLLRSVGDCPSTTTRSLAWIPDDTVAGQPAITFRTASCDTRQQVAWTGPGDFGRAIVAMPAPTGSADLWVGAPSQGLSRGALYRLSGALDLPNDARDAADASFSVEGQSPGDRLGAGLRRCADLTGDGQPDLLVASPGWSDPAPGAGAVILIDPANLPSDLDGVANLGVRWTGPGPGARAGASLWCDGDLDGDGRADVMIGAPGAGSEGEGRVWLVSGRTLRAGGPLDDLASVTLMGSEPDQALGASLDAADLDLDGALEILVGSPGSSSGVGAVLVWDGPSRTINPWGPPSVWEGRPAELVDGSRARSSFGATIASGDLDRDGLPEILAGGWRADRDGQIHAGEVLIWPGTLAAAGGGGTFDRAFAIRGEGAHQEVGRSLRVLDLDGDGVPDVWTSTRRRLR